MNAMCMHDFYCSHIIVSLVLLSFFSCPTENCKRHTFNWLNQMKWICNWKKGLSSTYMDVIAMCTSFILYFLLSASDLWRITKAKKQKFKTSASNKWKSIKSVNVDRKFIVSDSSNIYDYEWWNLHFVRMVGIMCHIK